jgi:hypothetical protein
MGTKKCKALIIPADQTAELRLEQLGTEPKDIQGVAGGPFQGIGFELPSAFDGPARPVVLYVSEYGKLDGLPLNSRATDLLRDVGVYGPADTLEGDVVCFGLQDGAETDVPADVVTYLPVYGAGFAVD